VLAVPPTLRKKGPGFVSYLRRCSFCYERQEITKDAEVKRLFCVAILCTACFQHLAQLMRPETRAVASVLLVDIGRRGDGS
jgi:hypothetical protein